MTSTRLVIIDTRVSDYEKIINGIKTETVSYVLLDYNTDTFETLLNKISELPLVNPLESVALVSHGVNAPFYKMIESMSPAQLYDVSSVDANLDSWSEFSNFFKCLCVPTIDLLGCAIYMNDNWKYVLNTLETQMEVNFRASVDDTGNLAVGGNWVLESDNVNIKDLYFNEGIEEWMGLLQNNGVSNPCIIDVTGNLYMIKDGIFTLVNTNRKVSQVSTGYDHIAYTDISNDLYTFGSNMTSRFTTGTGLSINGKLGYSEIRYLTEPSNNKVNVSNNRKIAQVACGLNHTLCLDTSGRVYSTGDNTFGQLGIGSSDTSRNSFTFIQSISNENIKQVCANNNSSMALSYSGKLYVWGFNGSNTLGISGDTTNKLTPTRIITSTSTNDISNRNITSASIGEYYYGFITASGEVFVHTIYNTSTIKTPRLYNITDEPSNNALSITATGANCFVIAKSNKMYIIGKEFPPVDMYMSDPQYQNPTILSFRLITNYLYVDNITPGAVVKSACSYEGNYGTGIHLLDTSGNLYAKGSNYANIAKYNTIDNSFSIISAPILGLPNANLYDLAPMTLLKITNPPTRILSINGDQPFDYTYLDDISVNSTSGIITWDNTLQPGTYDIIIDASSSQFTTQTTIRLEVSATRISPINFNFIPDTISYYYGAYIPIYPELNSNFNSGFNTDLSFIITTPYPALSLVNNTLIINNTGLDASSSSYNIKLSTFSISRPDLSANTTVSITVMKRTPLLYEVILSNAIYYGQKLSDSSFYAIRTNNEIITSGFFNVPGTISFDSPTTMPSVLDSSNTLYSWTFTPFDTINYTIYNTNKTVIVNKSDPSNVTLSFTDISYGRTLSQVGITQLFRNRYSPSSFPDVSGTLAFDNSATTIPNAGNTTSYLWTFTPRDLSNYNVINTSSIVKVDKTDPSNVSFSYNKNLFYGQPIGISNEISGRYVNKLNSSLGTVTGIFSFDNCGQILNTFDSSRNSQPWIFTPTSSNYNIVRGNVDISINKTTPELSGTIVDTDISFGDHITKSTITAIYRNPYTKIQITGTNTWDLSSTDLSGVPPVSFGVNRDYSSNIVGSRTTATFRPSNLTDISNHNNVSLGTLSVYIKATAPRNMAYNPSTIPVPIGSNGSSTQPLFNGALQGTNYDYGGLPLTYKIREIRKVV